MTTAAHEIQPAVDAAEAGDTVLVADGTYSAGGRPATGASITNRVAIDKPIVVQSLNGPVHTIIQGARAPIGDNSGNGYGAVRCAYVGSNAVLSGFTLINGHTEGSGNDSDISGGGAFCEATSLVTNCILVSNSALTFGGGAYGGKLVDCQLVANTAAYGGGASQASLLRSSLRNNVAGYGGGTAGGSLSRCSLIGNTALGAFGGGGAWAGNLDNCLLLSNTAAVYGGGALSGSLTNCTLVGNSATNRGGGAYNATLLNCIVYFNTAPLGTNHLFSTTDFCCTTPLPTNGTANIDAEPLFVNPGGGDYRLRFGSPCIEAGLDFDGLTNDFLGAPRVVDGDGDGIAFADIGAYEYNPESLDSDGDGATDAQEKIMDTSPTNAASLLRILDIAPGPPAVLQFNSSARRLYSLRFSTNLTETNWFEVPGAAGIPGNDGLLSLYDTNTSPARFYQVRVVSP